MTTSHFVPEVWSATLLAALETAHVYGGPGIANRDYEGEISAQGDTVKITSVSDPTIGDYVPGVTNIVPEQLQTSQRALVIERAKYYSFEVDDVDKRQQFGGIMAEGMKRAGYRLRDTADKYNAAKMVAGVQAANVLGTKTVIPHSATTTGAMSATTMDAFELLAQTGTLLTERDIPKEQRYAVIPAWFTLMLSLDERFTDASKLGRTGVVENGGAIPNGYVGRAAGFDLYESNNVPNSGGVFQVVAGVPEAYSFAEQIVSTEAFRPESSFSDAVKGLHVYGGKVVRPDHLAVAPVQRSA